ncbi:MAG: DUF456 domain-containing protein [Chitinophagales bacterium]|nr:DUF456 domain-containing protein [Chitinophagales bacterium]
MEIAIATIGIILIVIGLIFAVIPPLPGPPIAFFSLLIYQFGTDKKDIPVWILILIGVLAVASTYLDNLAAVWGTKKFGGTKAGVRGSFIGLIIAVFFTGWIPFVGPFTALLLGPFLGAVIGEMIAGNDINKAINSGIGSFIGFLMGMGIKIGVTLLIGIYFFKLVFFNV